MSNPDQFTKKPITIDAILWTGENIKAVMDFMQWRNASHDEKTGLLIHTLEGNLHANIGDWIIKGVKGEFYACKPDIFAATYSPAVAPTEAAAMAATVPSQLLQAAADAYSLLSTSDFHIPDEKYHVVTNLATAIHAAQAPVAGQPAEPSPADPIRGLLQAHEDLIEQGENYAYFELAYTRQTGWMAWLTDRPASGEPGTAEYAKSRKVIARGQGDSAEEACQDALDVMRAPKGDSNG